MKNILAFARIAIVAVTLLSPALFLAGCDGWWIEEEKIALDRDPGLDFNVNTTVQVTEDLSQTPAFAASPVASTDATDGTEILQNVEFDIETDIDPLPVYPAIGALNSWPSWEVWMEKPNEGFSSVYTRSKAADKSPAGYDPAGLSANTEAVIAYAAAGNYSAYIYQTNSATVGKYLASAWVLVGSIQATVTLSISNSDDLLRSQTWVFDRSSLSAAAVGTDEWKNSHWYRITLPVYSSTATNLTYRIDVVAGPGGTGKDPFIRIDSVSMQRLSTQ